MARYPRSFDPAPRDDEDKSRRLPPQNIEAESWTLGAVLIDGATFPAVKECLRGPDDFHRDSHQAMYRAMLALYSRGVPIDTITVHEEMMRAGEPAELNGDATETAEFVAGVANSAASAANGAYHAQIVRQKAEQRDVIEYASALLDAAYSNDHTSSDLMDRARRDLLRIETAARESAWQPPDLDAAYPVDPFPIDAFPLGFRRLCREMARSVPCPIDFVAIPALAVAGAAIGRSVALVVKKGWIEEANLWTAIVGKPGTGKTPPLKAVTRPLYRIFEEQLLGHQVEMEAIKARRREASAERKKLGGKLAGDFEDETPPALKRVLVGDTTCEALGLRLRDNPRGLVLVQDELAGMINGLNQYRSGGGNDVEFYLALWSRASYPIDRKGQDGGIPIYVRSPFLAMTGGIQPDKLDSIGSLKDGRRLNDGFLDRFLFAYPAEVPMRWTEDELDPETEAEWSAAVRRLWDRPMVPDGDGYDRPWTVGFTPEARERFAAWFDENCRAMEEWDFPEQMKGPYSKVRAYCARLALVVEQTWWAFDPSGRCDVPDVSLRAVEAAIRLSGYFDGHYRRVVGHLSGACAENPDAEAILRWLAGRESRTFTAKEAKDNFRGRFKADPRGLKAALAWLEARGIVRRVPDPFRPAAGRKPSPAYEVNPSLGEKARFLRDRIQGES